MRTESPGIRALYLRDYFFLHHSPRRGDEKAWRRVECAAIRIAESVDFMLKSLAVETRLREAKRVRRAARECVRAIPELRVDAWTLEESHFFEALADAVLAEIGSTGGSPRAH